MRIFIALVVFVVVSIVLAFAYVRLAPTDVARWHQMPEGTAPIDDLQTNSFRAVRKLAGTPAEVLQAVVQAADATERTGLIAGSVDEGMLTFQTRSRVWGFPDYTTVAVTDDLLIIHARARFGQEDLGVNKDRVDRWLAVLGPLTEPL